MKEITPELLCYNGYELIIGREKVAAIVNDFEMPFEYLDYCMWVKYDSQGNVDCVFGCAILSRDTLGHNQVYADTDHIQLLITDGTLRIYESVDTIECAIIEILQEMMELQ